MQFAIHQSRKSPTTYLFLRERDGLDAIPEGIREELGKVKFLRMSRGKEEETPAIASKYQEIIQNIGSRGYHLIMWASQGAGGRSGS
ncbi:YcgL domain-containing protein [Desulfovibrio sulfodismutans]|uniref:YcgL domain-containing protein n=1 Tax=Desulfolutivibrio sulfodismutans TaxID=63561 RepID=A0A7K3NR26_9BACT|nr:YcgL domain-containing protein [Desulfolutivibrio sulfodismutans]NDY58581.1 YcgL domain-containing protein [Desulfolutivibrio sulfodismutans]QLA12422.1 hypothetical protein GD606_09110 [Desulfolutivibrio sulfodismutans DSM 3696]